MIDKQEVEWLFDLSDKYEVSGMVNTIEYAFEYLTGNRGHVASTKIACNITELIESVINRESDVIGRILLYPSANASTPRLELLNCQRLQK